MALEDSLEEEIREVMTAAEVTTTSTMAGKAMRIVGNRHNHRIECHMENFIETILWAEIPRERRLIVITPEQLIQHVHS